MITEGNPGLQFRLSQDILDHTRQCYRWRQDCCLIPCSLGEAWGPSDAELIAAAALEFTIQVDFSPYESEPDDGSSSEADDNCWEDDELYDQMETMALRDQYAGRRPLAEEHYSSDSSVGVSPSKKRRRHN